MPAPFLMARSMVSLVTEDFLAFSTATNRRALRSGSAPPSLAATMISRVSLTTIWPFLCALISRPACFHCAPINFCERGEANKFPNPSQRIVNSVQHGRAVFFKIFIRRHHGQLIQLCGGDDETVKGIVMNRRQFPCRDANIEFKGKNS